MLFHIRKPRDDTIQHRNESGMRIAAEAIMYIYLRASRSSSSIVPHFATMPPNQGRLNESTHGEEIPHQEQFHSHSWPLHQSPCQA